MALMMAVLIVARFRHSACHWPTLASATEQPGTGTQLQIAILRRHLISPRHSVLSECHLSVARHLSVRVRVCTW